MDGWITLHKLLLNGNKVVLSYTVTQRQKKCGIELELVTQVVLLIGICLPMCNNVAQNSVTQREQTKKTITLCQHCSSVNEPSY